MWGWLASFLSGPLLGGILKAYQAKLAAGNTTERIDADLAARELAVQAREIEAQQAIRIAEIGKWYEPEKLMGYGVAFYIVKVLVWDAALGFGSTDPVRGAVGDWMGLIVTFYFGKRGIENVARIIKR